MSYSYDNTNCPSIRSYADAVAVWNSVKHFRGMVANDPRPLESRRKYHVTICVGAGSARLKLHGTNVVTYYDDGRLVIDNGFGSTSTENFARRLTPGGVELLSGRGTLWLYAPEAHRAYNIGHGTMTLTPTSNGVWQPVNPKPWFVPRLDKFKARKALKDYGYNQFKAWLQMRERLSVASIGFVGHFSLGDLRGGLKRWVKAVEISQETSWQRVSSGGLLGRLRDQVYVDAGALTVETKPYLIEGEYGKAIRSIKKYGHLRTKENVHATEHTV